MSGAQKRALANHRRRLKRRGLMRIEIQVGKNDAALVREIARALADPTQEAETRSLLQRRFGALQAKGLKQLLAAAPLEGIDLTREREPARDLAL